MKKLVLLMALVVAASNAFSAFRSNGQLPVNVSSVAETDSLLVVDSLALVALYEQCNGPEWQNSANWLDGPLDTWYGVTVENNRVTILQLEGEWHTKFGLENTLPSQMGDLTALKILNLGYNNLTDAFPEVTGSMKNLEDLNLAGNNLQGPLPDTLWGLTNLTRLDLSGNQLTGALPGNIGQLTNLRTLILYGNGFNDTIPPEIGDLAQLMMLDLSDNEFTGAILEHVTTLDSLTHLILEDNHFTGTVPAEIGRLKKLEFLDLRNNQFSGELPGEIGELTNMLSFSLNNNQFHGAIPKSVVGFTRISEFVVENNNFHALPALVNSPFVEHLVLAGNRFTFEDIEPNLALGNKKGDFFYEYENQQKIGTEETKYAPPGEPFTLSVYCGGRNNLYQWFKDGVEVTGVTESPEYVIEEVVEGENGVYHCQVTNLRMVNLTIESHPVTVTGKDTLMANAGHDFAASADSVVTLDGTASYSPGGQALTYSWMAPEGIELTNADSAQPQFTAPEVDYDTPFMFSLVVGDGMEEAEDEVAVTIRAPRMAPVARAGYDQFVNEGEEVELDGSDSYSAYYDHDYIWTAPAGIELNSTFDSRPFFTAPEVDADTVYTFILVINDGTDDSEPDEVKVTVLNYSEVPVADAGASRMVNAGETVTLDGSASTDPQGDTLSFVWLAPEGIVLDDSTQVQSMFVAPEYNADTTLTFYLAVTNSKELSDTASVDITIVSVAVGVHQAESGSFQVYPNPSDGHIMLRLHDYEAGGEYRLIVTSASGVRILEKQITGAGPTPVDLSLHPAGMYVVQVAGMGETYVGRIMKR